MTPYILAFLLKQTVKFHKKNASVKSADETVTAINKELRYHDSSDVGVAGLRWAWLKRQGLDTGHIYIILTQLALLMTEHQALYFYTEAYENVIKDLLSKIEKGVDVQEWRSLEYYSCKLLEPLSD